MSFWKWAIALFILLTPRIVEASCVSYPELCGLTVHSTIEQPDLAVAIDIVIMGDGFTDVASWTPIADAHINSFRNHSAGLYTAMSNIYNFHVVDVVSQTTDVADNDTTDTALGMKTGGSVITAISSRMNTAALNAPDVDVIIAVANAGSGRANANYNSQLASGGRVRVRRSSSPTTHELGHALFHLADEYVESSKCSNPAESGLMTEPNVTAEPTCFKFSTTSGAGCVEGGKYCASGVWRSASGCLMRSSGSAACPVCAQEVEEVLLERRTQADHAAPWVVVTSPAEGAAVAGVISLQARVHDDWFQPTVVVFEVDGAFWEATETIGTTARSSFDTRMLADGTHTITAYGIDAANYVGTARPVTFSTLNFSDTTAPQVTITTPQDGAQVEGTVMVAASAPGELDLQQITLSIDNSPRAVAVGRTSLSYSWDVTSETPGAHTITAEAVDFSQNVGSAGPITVTTSTTTTGSGYLMVQIFSPNDWSPVGPTFGLGFFAGGGSVGGQHGSSNLTLDLLLDGAPIVPSPLVSTGGEGGGETMIDASGWALGPHQLQVSASDSSTTAYSNVVVLVRVLPTDPAAFVLDPASGSWVSGTVSVEITGYDDLPLTALALFVDGQEIGVTNSAPGTVAWDTTTYDDGCIEVEAEARASDGATVRSNSISLCVDNHPPTVAIILPQDGQTVPEGNLGVQVETTDEGSGVAQVELLVDGQPASTSFGGSSSLLAVLSAGPHTLQARATDRAGHVGSSAVVNVTANSCVANGCDDSDPCTTDRCAATGACVHEPMPNCCAAAGDCDDGDLCTTDSCNTSNLCENVSVAGCCNHDHDCDDGDACTTETCSGIGGTCVVGPNVCCANDPECNDNESCTTDSCVLPEAFCANNWILDCCHIDDDCDDGDACTTNTCASGTCTSTSVPNCCRSGGDCDDGDLCTVDLCRSGVCENRPIQGCCEVDGDCTSLNPCADPSCNARNNCEFGTLPGCCNFDSECGDGDVCTDDACTNNACVNISSPLCCTTDPQCDDTDDCTDDFCGQDNRCDATPIPGCCHNDPECDDGDPCTTNTCVNLQCQTASVADCCHDATECDDNDECTEDQCLNNVCVHPSSGICCTVSADCDDSDVCTTDVCEPNDRCSNTTIAGCCNTDPECDDNDVCTADVCENDNTCSNTAIVPCCQSAAECDDNDPCTIDTCDASNQCSNLPDPSCGSQDDAGTTHPDASTPAEDSGVSGTSPLTGPGVDGKCGCRSTGATSSNLWPLLIFGLLLVRSRFDPR